MKKTALSMLMAAAAGFATASAETAVPDAGPCRTVSSWTFPTSWYNRHFYVSDDASSFAYTYMTNEPGGFQRLVKDGKEIAATDWTWLSHNGGSLFYEAGGTWFIHSDRKSFYRDGVAIERKDGIVSKSGRTAARIDQDEKLMYRVHFGGATSPGYDYSHPWTAVFSDSEESFLMTAERKGKSYVVFNGKEASPGYGSIGLGGFFPGSEAYAYVAEDRGRYFVVSNGRKLRSFDFPIGRLRLSGNGKDVVYEVDAPGWLIVRNDDIVGKWTLPAISPRGDKIAYVKWYLEGDLSNANIGSQSVVNDGVEGETHRDSMVADLTYSPDGSSLAYLLNDLSGDVAGYYFVNGGRRSARYPGAEYGSIAFSGDSKHLKFVAKDADGNMVPVLDGKELGKYGKVVDRGFVGNEFRFASISDRGYVLLACATDADGTGSYAPSASVRASVENVKPKAKAWYDSRVTTFGKTKADEQAAAVAEKLRAMHLRAKARGKRANAWAFEAIGEYVRSLVDEGRFRDSVK